MSERMQAVLTEIDTANSADPNSEDGKPEALLYGQRMSDELARLRPDASEILQIAARGQHVERWKLARSAYPEGRAGYLAWRKAQGAHHAETVAAMMSRAGYDETDLAVVGQLLRKEGIKRNADVQTLEDVACFVFLRWYFTPFAKKHTPDKIQNIVEKTARKMSEKARQRVLQEFDLPAELAAAFQA